MNKEFFPMNDWSIPTWEWGQRKSLKEGKMDKQTMYRNLIDFKESCDKYNLQFVIIFGALLGLIKQGDLIDHDSDIDVMCFTEVSHWKDYYKFGYVIENMKKKGFYVTDRKWCPFHDIGFTRGGEKIEIWMFQKIDNERVYNSIARFPLHFFEPLKQYKFLGTEFNIPNHPEELLDYTYGKEWRTKNHGAYILEKYKHKHESNYNNPNFKEEK